jgi:hypothetical protein
LQEFNIILGNVEKRGRFDRHRSAREWTDYGRRMRKEAASHGFMI